MKKHFTLPSLFIVLSFCFFTTHAFAQATIGGKITCFEPDGSPLDIVKVLIEGPLLQEPISVSTDANGYYQSPALPLGGSYTITPLKEAESYIQGVTTFDIVLVIKGILSYVIPTPFQLLAADVNQSGTVSSFDAVIMRKWILTINEGPYYQIWRFATTNFEFPNPLNPGSSGWVDSATVLLSSDIEDLDWVGVLTGDLNGSGCPR